MKMPDDEQQDLAGFDRNMVERVDKAHHKMGDYTAELFEKLSKERYALAVKGIAMGIPWERIRKDLGVTWRTIRAVARRVSPKTIAEQKKEIGEKCFDLVNYWIELVGADPKLVQKLGPLGAGILVDKALHLHGEASSITEVRVQDPAADRLRAALADLPMHARAEKNGGKSATALPAGPEGAGLQVIEAEFELTGGNAPPL